MNRKTSVLLGTLLLGALCTVGGAATGDAPPVPGTGPGPGPRTGPGPGGPPGAANPGGPGLLGELGDRLGLSPEQRAKVVMVFDAARPEMDRIRNESRQVQIEFESMDPDDPRFADATRKASEAAGKAASASVLQAAKTRLAIWKILTAEQQARMRQLEADFRSRMESSRGPRPGGPPPLPATPPPPPPPPPGQH